MDGAERGPDQTFTTQLRQASAHGFTPEQSLVQRSIRPVGQIGYWLMWQEIKPCVKPIGGIDRPFICTLVTRDRISWTR
jgi:hypothetical protein